jgi:aminoglycoside phosphotransferase (APT) family kinase protein
MKRFLQPAGSVDVLPEDSLDVLNATHHDRLVWTTTRDNRTVVVKRYKSADASSVFVNMSKLWQSPFGANRNPAGLPEPIICVNNEMTMSQVVGEPLGTRGHVGQTRFYLHQLAELVADLHSCGVVVPRVRTSSKLMRSLARKLHGMNPIIAREYAAALRHTELIAPAHEDVVASHGDLSPRNVLVTETGLVLIDFDRLQMAGRGRDLAYLGAWMWATELLADGSDSWSFADALAEEYCEYSQLPVDGWRTDAAFYRSAALLRIAQSWTVFGTQPEQRRRIISEARCIAQTVCGA